MKILIVKLSSLGDVVHTLPVVQDILAALPQAQIDWVVEAPFAPVLALCPGVNRVVVCELRRWRGSPLSAATRRAWRAFKQQLRLVAYDAVIDAQGLTKSALVAWLARLAPDGKRYALANQTDGSGYEGPTRWVSDVAIAMPARIHAVQRGRALAAAALGYSLAGTPKYDLKMPLRQPVRTFVATKNIANEAVKIQDTDTDTNTATGLAVQARESLHDFGQAVAVGSKWAATRSVTANTLAGGDKNNALNRLSPTEREPQKAVQSLPAGETHTKQHSRQPAVALTHAACALPLGPVPIASPSAAPGAALDHTLVAARSVAFIHGTSRADKAWPLAHWLALGQRMQAAGYIVVLTHGNAAELATSQAIASALNAPQSGGDLAAPKASVAVPALTQLAERCARVTQPTAVVLPMLALDALAGVLRACAGVVGVDSGVSHLATALDLPHVQIYNFDTAWRTGPQSPACNARQASVFALPAPSVQAVWHAWLSCAGV